MLTVTLMSLMVLARPVTFSEEVMPVAAVVRDRQIDAAGTYALRSAHVIGAIVVGVEINHGGGNRVSPASNTPSPLLSI